MWSWTLIQLFALHSSEIHAPYKVQYPLSEHCSPSLLAFPAVFLPAFQPGEEKGITELSISFTITVP